VLNVLVKEVIEKDMRWTLSTVDGKLVNTGLIPGAGTAQSQFTMDVSGLSNGLYFLTIGQGDMSRVVKVVVE
jgi:hypothetical protein